MTKQKSTKRALLMSALSLLLCVSMLIGSTFAWFTDSVVSGNNIIKSGNLDIVVEYTLGDKDTEGNFVWKDLAGATDLFQKGLWEPGHTEVVALRIKNNGTLALKYNANMNIVSETIGKTKDGKDIKLSDILTVSTLTQQANDENGANWAGDVSLMLAFEGENAGGLKYDAPTKFNESILGVDQMLLPGHAYYVIVKVDMDETVGNEANHNGTDIPEINFGINVLATQYTSEKDSFGNNYDKDADYVEYDYVIDSSDELKEAFANGGNILLTDDIEFEKIIAVEPGAEVYLNLNGKTITVDENTESNTLIYVKDGAKLTIDGDGTIDLGEVSTMAIFAPYGELVIENGTFIRDKVETVTNKTTGLFMGAKTTASNVTINGGYFDPGYYDANAKDIEGLLAGTVEFTETADDVAKRGNSKDANLVRVAIKDNVSVILNHSGYGSFKVYGGTFVGANPAWGDEGCMLPTTPNYLRPWSYYQGALLDGQVYNENGVVLPDGYTITTSVNADNVPVYTVTYSK